MKTTQLTITAYDGIFRLKVRYEVNIPYNRGRQRHASDPLVVGEKVGNEGSISVVKTRGFSATRARFLNACHLQTASDFSHVLRLRDIMKDQKKEEYFMKAV